MTGQLIKNLHAFWNAIQNFAQNAVEEENIKLFQSIVQGSTRLDLLFDTSLIRYTFSKVQRIAIVGTIIIKEVK